MTSSTAVGRSARCSRPRSSQVGQADHQLVVDAAVDLHDGDELGQLATVVEDLGDLFLVLGEDDLGLGVGQDEGDVIVLGGGIDRRRRTARRT